MATSDKTGPDDEVVEGSWSPKRTTSKKAQAQSSSDPEVLAGEIEKTREELAETLDAIADKVSPKRVTARTKKAAKDGAADAVESVKETVVAAKDAAKDKAQAAVESTKEKVAGGEPAPVVPLAAAEVPVEVAPTPPAAPSEVPSPYTSTLPPAAPSRAPMYAGAVAAAVVAFWLLRRGRR